jgi:hypothetical protein
MPMLEKAAVENEGKFNNGKGLAVDTSRLSDIRKPFVKIKAIPSKFNISHTSCVWIKIRGSGLPCKLTAQPIG